MGFGVIKDGDPEFQRWDRLGTLEKSEDPPFLPSPHSRLRNPEPKLLAWGVRLALRMQGQRDCPSFFTLVKLGGFQRVEQTCDYSRQAGSEC